MLFGVFQFWIKQSCQTLCEAETRTVWNMAWNESSMTIFPLSLESLPEDS